MSSTRLPFRLITTTLAALVIFFVIAIEVMNRQGILILDLWINQNIVYLRTPIITTLMLVINDLFIPVGIASILILFVYMLSKKRRYFSALISFSSVFAILANFVCEFIIPRDRPYNALVQVSGTSFPSGHALLASVLFVLLIICFMDSISNRKKRYIFIGINLGLLLLISLRGVYLNVHWASDVIAGIDLGILVIGVGILILRNYEERLDRKLIQNH